MVQVQLLDGIFKESADKGMDYLLFLDIDRLVAPFYEAASLAPKKQRYGGWEETGISGHSLGHWLSAAAYMYRNTMNRALKDKINKAIDELEYIQSVHDRNFIGGFPSTCFEKVFTGNFEVDHFTLAGHWVPWYSMHKLFAGLIDVYKLVKNEKALSVVTKLADWVESGTVRLTEAQFQKMLICEHGGMNDVMAELYLLTQNQTYLQLAIRFCEQQILEPLSNRRDLLEGKHANTQIPKVIGAAKLYDITKEEKYKTAATFFWQEVTRVRSYIIGGNSINEHFGRVSDETLGVQTTETCNTYNMLKLTAHLFLWEQKSEYYDFYERALYNHILASQDPDSGMKAYFVSTEPGHFKVYHSPEDSFWCCTGTGMENPTRYSEHIYYQRDDELFVNLFIASQLQLEEKELRLKLETDFPHSGRVQLKVEEGDGRFLSIHLRIPYWINGKVSIFVNKKQTFLTDKKGYVTLSRRWKAGDRVEVDFPLGLHSYIAKDDPNKVGFMYGPIVLAGALGRENFPETDIQANHLSLNAHPLIDVPVFIADKDRPWNWIKRVDGLPIQFETEPVGQPGNQRVTLIPFYQLHHERYSLYWSVMDENSFKALKSLEKEKETRLKQITIDVVQPNEQQEEIEHFIQKKNSRSGYLNTVRRGWRDCRDDGFFSYKMKVEPEKQMYLSIDFFNGDREIFIDGSQYIRHFTIAIDEVPIAEKRLEADGYEHELVQDIYEIPYYLTEDKQIVEVKFSSSYGKVAGGVYGIKMLRENLND
ncbi:acetyl-CoA carboxylase [Alkalihalobacillus alcalophilus ATCC 27647 = CGMCC 1.3604]|uniref:Acetyl-CoA carboxylase n=2 Tax=Alkalihalobacillus alcalophilus TaxID=1445 RepID=A0A4S4K0C6_ALKAL|nr:beta-L-arabinofuranosidase domain-containing protein [Alkalihalobacillus alcalophilus]MED1563731.1 glycoside hydrolase family 127 protein [Alkalihalobacillus alcalophilus]THG91036.1 acetyl-CoA carboxylase [Alkalihalobacillus alcalophilus ATCC 27647 = CGMCC 1.3604]